MNRQATSLTLCVLFPLVLGVGCASVQPERSAAPVSIKIQDTEPVAPLTLPGGGDIVTVALDVHQLDTIATYSNGEGALQAGSSRPQAAPVYRAADPPKPAGPTRPGGRGIGYPVSAEIEAGFSGPVPAQNNPFGAGSPPSPSAPTLETSFDSTDFDTNGMLTGAAFIPPDAHGAAGPNHVMSVTNVTYQIHDKTGTSICLISQKDFFSSLSPANELFDPKILYDQHHDRWVIVTLEKTNTTSRIFVAVSDDDNPSDPLPGPECGTWYIAAIDSTIDVGGNDHWTDYPGFAADEEAIYITGNLFRLTGNAFGGVRLWILDKFGGAGGGLYGGGTATVSSALDPYAGGGIEVTTQPAHIFGTAPASPNVGTYLISYSGITEDFLLSSDSGQEAIQLVRVDDSLTTPTFTQEFIDVGNIESLVTAGGLADASQKDTAVLVEVNDRRALSAVWRNNTLYLAATIEPNSGTENGQTTAHWWAFDTTVPSNGVEPPETILADQGDVGGDDITGDANPVFTFFPALTINSADELAIGFSASSTTIYPGSFYTSRKPTDSPASTRASATLRSGLDWYDRDFGGSRNRWGDYSAAVVDPVDQCFWIYNQHALTKSGTPLDNGRWGTAFGRFCSCPANWTHSTPTSGTSASASADDLIVTGTADVSSGGDLTLKGLTVSFEDGFSVEAGSTLTVIPGC